MPGESPSAKVVVLPGDGVGPEVVESARVCLEALTSDIRFESYPFGGAAIDELGEPLPASTLEACKGADAVLLGAIGGPKWDGASIRPEAGLLSLRKSLDLYANLRPVLPHPAVAQAASPLRSDYLEGVDLLVVRELTGGIYFGQPRWRDIVDGEERAVDTTDYRTSTIERIARLAFELASERRGLVTSIDKANVLATSKLWRDVVSRVHEEYPKVELNHQLVDSAAMRLITHAKDFDVLLTSNLFGDILSDEAAVLVGSLGLLPSASLGGEARFGLYEPIHGSAPDIAGQGIANPIGTILSAAMLLRHSLGQAEHARQLEAAVRHALDQGARTRDIGGTLSTLEMTDAIVDRLRRQ